MAARGRTVATPGWIEPFANKVWRAEMGRKKRVPIIYKSRAHIDGWRGIGVYGSARYVHGTYINIWLEVGRDVSPLRVKYVVLHELVHTMLPVHVNHTSVFYERLFPIYQKYLNEEELKAAMQHEMQYMPKGATAALRSNPQLRRYT